MLEFVKNTRFHPGTTSEFGTWRGITRDGDFMFALFDGYDGKWIVVTFNREMHITSYYDRLHGDLPGMVDNLPSPSAERLKEMYWPDDL